MDVVSFVFASMFAFLIDFILLCFQTEASVELQHSDATVFHYSSFDLITQPKSVFYFSWPSVLMELTSLSQSQGVYLSLTGR